MASENELTIALMRLCDDPDAHDSLRMEASANYGRTVMLDCSYDDGLSATFSELMRGTSASQRILTTIDMDAPSACSARRIAYAYHDLISTVGNPVTVTADVLEQRIALFAPDIWDGDGLGAAPSISVMVSADDPCAFELHCTSAPHDDAARTAQRHALLRFHGAAANGFTCATLWQLEDGYASYAMLDYSSGPLDDIIVDVLCTLRFQIVRGWQ